MQRKNDASFGTDAGRVRSLVGTIFAHFSLGFVRLGNLTRVDRFCDSFQWEIMQMSSITGHPSPFIGRIHLRPFSLSLASIYLVIVIRLQVDSPTTGFEWDIMQIVARMGQIHSKTVGVLRDGRRPSPFIGRIRWGSFSSLLSLASLIVHISFPISLVSAHYQRELDAISAWPVLTTEIISLFCFVAFRRRFRFCGRRRAGGARSVSFELCGRHGNADGNGVILLLVALFRATTPFRPIGSPNGPCHFASFTEFYRVLPSFFALLSTSTEWYRVANGFVTFLDRPETQFT